MFIASTDPQFGDIDGGDLITFTGTGLGNCTAVLFDGVPGTDLTVSDEEVTVVSPAHAVGFADIVLVVSGFELFATAYEYQSIRIDEISPAYLNVDGGQTLTITGAHLDLATSVTIDDVDAGTITPVSPGEISVETAAHEAATGIVVVVDGGVEGGSDSSTVDFVDPPTIAALIPDHGPVTTGFTLFGTHLVGTTSVLVGGVPVAGFSYISGHLEVPTTPSLAVGLHDVTVNTSHGNVTAEDAFEVDA